MANYKHGGGHGKLTKDTEAFLWTLPEIKELERLQGSRWEKLANKNQDKIKTTTITYSLN